jgi:TolB protein
MKYGHFELFVYTPNRKRACTGTSRMWERSPTFRRQGRRLAAERRLHVQLLVEDLPSRRLEFHARSYLTYDGAALVSARVHVRPGPDAIEHIAHELEHVLEQLDGVDVRHHEDSGMAWKSGDGSYESRRAKEVGRRVAREVAGIAPAVMSAQTMAVNQGGGFLRLSQRDRASTWGTGPSARISASGRHLVFASAAPLVAEDRNDLPDIYVVDLATGQLSLESVGPGGVAADGWSANPDISTDGRFVVFESTAGNLADVPRVSGEVQVFQRDRLAGVTWLLSANVHGAPANGFSRHAAISADGTAVVFESTATDLTTPTGTEMTSVGIYLFRLASGERVRIDVPASGGPHGGASMSPAISADGRYVAFASQADLVGENDVWPVSRTAEMRRASAIYVRDTRLQVTTRISSNATGGASDGASYHPAISANGRYVVFASEATYLAARRGSRIAQIYVHDRATGTTEIVSRRPDSRPADGASRFPAISGDGSTIAFQSLASNLVCVKRCADAERDINLVSDVYVLDRASGKMTRASRDGSGVEWMAPSRGPSLDHTGRVLAFSSRHPIDDDDVDHDDDLYVYTSMDASDPDSRRQPGEPELL